MSFDEVWNNIIRCAGQEFHTKTGLPFTYTVVDGYVMPNRTNYLLARQQFQKAAEIPNITGPGQISDKVRGPSYVFAILTDPRIR